jgi:hypothetical protein
MVNAGLLIGWKEPRPGREPLAAELWTSSNAFYQSKVKDGTFDSFEPVIVARHGGQLGGFFLLRGADAKLDAFRRSDEFLAWSTKAIYCLDGFTVVDAYVGAGLDRLMKQWVTSLPKK